MRFLAAAASGLIVMTALGHDFWIQPSSFRPAVGAPVRVELRVGDTYPGEPVPRRDERIVKFVSVGLDGERAIAGMNEREPAGMVRFERPGAYILAYRTNHADVTLEPVKFEGYLREKGLEAIVAARAERNESGKNGVEKYSRSVKSLVLVGGGAKAAEFDRAIGLDLELVAESNPYATSPGEPLRFRLLYMGKPLANALVTAASPEVATSPTPQRTDAEGRVTFRLPAAKMWKINAVHMVRATPELGADWESIWASLTFEFTAK